MSKLLGRHDPLSLMSALSEDIKPQEKRPMSEQDILIVFTDEVGSTNRDLALSTPQDILKPREALFLAQLSQTRPPDWTVLKSVGDSLVFRFQGATLSDGIMAICRAWRFFNNGNSTTRMRVAIHSPTSGVDEVIANGSTLKAQLKKMLQRKPINIALHRVWPSHVSLDADIFGMAMNYTARLASLPRESLFIVSKEVIDKLENRSLFEEALAKENCRLSSAVPIVYLKGFADYLGLDGEPKSPSANSNTKLPITRYVHEISDKNSPPRKNLFAESKAKAALRILYIQVAGGTGVPRGHIKLAEQELRQRLEMSGDGTSRALGFYVDAAFKIAELWIGPLIRDGAKAGPLTKVERQRSLYATFLVLTSVPDETVDNLVRRKLRVYERLQDGRSYRDVHIQVETEQIHLAPYFLGDVWRDMMDDSPNNAQDSSPLWLLLFQIRPESKRTGDSPSLFHDLRELQIELKEDKTQVASLYPISCGLIVGHVDGYVIYRSQPDNEEGEWKSEWDEAVLECLEAECGKRGRNRLLPEDFLPQVAPFKLMKLTRHEFSYMNSEPGPRNVWAFEDLATWIESMKLLENH